MKDEKNEDTINESVLFTRIAKRKGGNNKKIEKK